MRNPTSATDETDLHHLRRSFVRHLAADGRSAATRTAYATAIAQLEAFVVVHRLSIRVADLQPDQLEAFVVSLYERGLRPTTILARYQALVQFFDWLVDEDELPASPMTSIRPPAAALPSPRLLAGEEIAALLAACTGPAFEDLRDAAIIRLFVETGLRRSELAALQLATSTSSSTRCTSRGPGAHRGQCRSIGRRWPRSTATWRRVSATRGPTCRSSGWGGVDG